MPDIPPELINSVVTLLAPHPIGTGFVVQRPRSGRDSGRCCLVTCEHCIREPVTARFCTGLRMEFSPDDWIHSKTLDDVVGVDVTDLLQPAGDFGFVDAEKTVAKDEPFYGLGSDVYMLGTFVSESDFGRNVPRARFGNISAIAAADVLVKQGNGSHRPTHIADMRSRSGFSGSPVFGYLTIQGLSGSVIYREKLLGMHSAQYDERVKIIGKDREFNLDIPSSMTKIVPAWCILDLLDEVASTVHSRSGTFPA